MKAETNASTRLLNRLAVHLRPQAQADGFDAFEAASDHYMAQYLNVSPAMLSKWRNGGNLANWRAIQLCEMIAPGDDRLKISYVCELERERAEKLAAGEKAEQFVPIVELWDQLKRSVGVVLVAVVVVMVPERTEASPLSAVETTSPINIMLNRIRRWLARFRRALRRTLPAIDLPSKPPCDAMPSCWGNVSPGRSV